MGLLSSAASFAVDALPFASSALSFLGGERANEANLDIYKHQYQWMVQDMRKAGLNPILAAQLGRTGPLPTMQNTMAPAVDAGWNALSAQQGAGLTRTQAEHTARDISRVEAETRRIEAQTEVLYDEVNRVITQANLNSAQAAVAREMIKVVGAQYQTELQRARELAARGDVREAEAAVEKIMAQFYQDYPIVLKMQRTGVAGAAEGAVKAGILGWLFNRGRGGAKK